MYKLCTPSYSSRLAGWKIGIIVVGCGCTKHGLNNGTVIIEMTINVWVKCICFEGSRLFLRNFSKKKKKYYFLEVQRTKNYVNNQNLTCPNAQLVRLNHVQSPLLAAHLDDVRSR